jgi:hypothetical protein
MSILNRIIREHRKIQTLLEQEQRHRMPDSVRIIALKKMKLALKDKMQLSKKKFSLSY